MKAIVKVAHDGDEIQDVTIRLLPCPKDENDVADENALKKLICDLQRVGAFLINAPSGDVIEVDGAEVLYFER